MLSKAKNGRDFHKNPKSILLTSEIRYKFAQYSRFLDPPTEIADVGLRIYTRNYVILRHKFEAKNRNESLTP